MKRERRRQQQKHRQWIESELLIVGELQNFRQFSDDHWQGTDVDGSIIDVKGGNIGREL
jgi:hypothetical protein